MFAIASYIARQKIAKLVNIDTISFFFNESLISTTLHAKHHLFLHGNECCYTLYIICVYSCPDTFYSLIIYLSINLIFIYYKLHIIIKSSSILLYLSLLQSRCIRVKFCLIIIPKPFKIKNFSINQSIEVICI